MWFKRKLRMLKNLFAPNVRSAKIMKYRKKPVAIEAWQFTKKNFAEGVPRWIRYIGEEGNLKDNKAVVLWSQYGGKVIAGEIKTLEGIMTVSENDWIIKGINGEFYPCKPDIFEATYEAVE